MKRVLINDVNAVDQVITSLKNKEIIVYPTDTIYGIGTDANNDSGIQKINGLKQRTGPMTIIIHEFEDISNKIVINPILEEQMLKIVNNGDTCIVFDLLLDAGILQTNNPSKIYVFEDDTISQIR